MLSGGTWGTVRVPAAAAGGPSSRARGVSADPHSGHVLRSLGGHPAAHPQTPKNSASSSSPRGKPPLLLLAGKLLGASPAATHLCHVVPLLEASSGVCCGPVTLDQARVSSWRRGPFLATPPLPRRPHLHGPRAPGPGVQATEAEASLASPTAVLRSPTPWVGGSGIHLSEPRATSPPSPWARPELGPRVVTRCVPLVPETAPIPPPSESHCCN